MSSIVDPRSGDQGDNGRVLPAASDRETVEELSQSLFAYLSFLHRAGEREETFLIGKLLPPIFLLHNSFHPRFENAIPPVLVRARFRNPLSKSAQ